MSPQAVSDRNAASGFHANTGRKQLAGFMLFHRIALAGFVLFAVSAPHSIAASEIGLGLAALGWVGRTLVTRKAGFRRTTLDLPIWLYFGWSIVSAFVSQE